MKWTVSIMLSLTLGGCINSASDNIREFIPGMYIRKVHNEFTDGWDTLVIKEQDRDAGVYLIDKMESYQKHIDGQTFSPKYETEQWTAVYDERLHQLLVQNKERTILFDPAENELMSNRTVYDKVTRK